MKRFFIVGALGATALLAIYLIYVYIVVPFVIRPPPAFHPPLPNPSLSLIIEPDDGITSVLSLINSAKTSIELVMYDLQDTEVEKALVSAQARSVSVRVLLNKGYYGAPSPTNEPAYEYLEANSVPVRWTPASFALTHEKLLVVDDADTLIMGFNLTPAYYASSRDFAANDNDPADIAALENVFNADWGNKEINAPEGDDLVWSPHAETEILSLISQARHSLLIYNEEMSDSEVVQALKDAASRGVSVNIIMTYQSTWKSAFLSLSASHVHVRAYAENAPLYIHAKMIVADNTEAFIGSENFSASSLNNNRELGILITKPSIIATLTSTFGTDWSGIEGN
jgi:cardiolipin synthase